MPSASAGPARRRNHRVAVSAAMLSVALGFSLLNEQTILLGRYHHPLWLRGLDVVLGVACLAGVYWCRRWPVAFAVFAIVAGTISTLGAGTSLVGVFAVAVHRPWRTSVAVSLLAIVSILASLLLYPMPHFWLNASVGILLTAALTGWGMFVRARRQLLASLRADVAREREHAIERVVAARRTERERIAREMHDVLAHRLSLLAVHAGSLQFHPDASPAAIARAADVIRDSAHAALEDLRSVIAVLRDPDTDDDDRPQPTAADIPELIEESRTSGLTVRLTAPAALDRLDPTIGRTLYRIVQEGLTNVRKHAPSARVEVTIGGRPGTCLDVTVQNTTTAGATSRVPGSGTGLIGLRERALLAGGSLEHGPVDDGTGYRLEAHLPWRLAPSLHPDGGSDGIRGGAPPQEARRT